MQNKSPPRKWIFSVPLSSLKSKRYVKFPLKSTEGKQLSETFLLKIKVEIFKGSLLFLSHIYYALLTKIFWISGHKSSSDFNQFSFVVVAR